MLTKDQPLLARLEKEAARQDWQLDHLTTATSAVVALNEQAYAAMIWDLAASNLDTTLATMMLLRPGCAFPLLVLAPAPDERTQRKLTAVKVDAVLDSGVGMRLLVATLTQRWWLYDRLPQAQEDQPPAPPKQRGWQLGAVTVDPGQLVVTKKGQAVNLTKKEFQLLTYLCEHQNQVLSREQLLTGVWGYDLLGSSRIVDIHVSHLRDKLEDDPKRPRLIETVRGFGYRLVGDEKKATR